MAMLIKMVGTFVVLALILLQGPSGLQLLVCYGEHGPSVAPSLPEGYAIISLTVPNERAVAEFHCGRCSDASVLENAVSRHLRRCSTPTLISTACVLAIDRYARAKSFLQMEPSTDSASKPRTAMIFSPVLRI